MSQTRFAIFSLKALNNRHVLVNTLTDLRSQGIEAKEVLGAYKGRTETSILAFVPEDTHLDLIRDLAFKDGQESILVVDEDLKARLEYNPSMFGPNDGFEGDIKQLGDWAEVSPL